MEFGDGFSFLSVACSPRLHKTESEIAVMQYIKEKTAIPVPSIVEGPCGMGPYILMEFIYSTSHLIENLKGAWLC